MARDPNASYADKAAYRAQETGKPFWDKGSPMDAYDAGGLTFEIAVFLLYPQPGAWLWDQARSLQAAEMIQLWAKNSTKGKNSCNAENGVQRLTRFCGRAIMSLEDLARNYRYPNPSRHS